MSTIGGHSFTFSSIAKTTRNWPVIAHLSLPAREDIGRFSSHGFNITSMNAPAKTLIATSTASPSTFTTLSTPSTVTASASLIETSSTGAPSSSAATTSHGGFFRDDGHFRSHHGGGGGRGGGLSTGAIVGIVVAIIAGGLALLAPAIWLHMRRRRLRRELAAMTNQEPPKAPPKDSPTIPNSELQHQFSKSSSQSWVRKLSSASTTIVVGMAPSRRPTDASVSPAARPKTAVHELHSSAVIEMPATPLLKAQGGADRQAGRLGSVQVYEMGSENARLEKEIYQKLEN